QCLVEETQGVWHVHLAEPFETIAGADGVAGRSLLTTAVEGEDSGALERGGMERAGSMRQMVRDEVPPVRGGPGMHAPEARLQVMRRPIGELARRVNDRGEEESVPGRLGSLSLGMPAGVQWQGNRRLLALPAEQQIGVEGVGDVIDLFQSDSHL